MATAAGLRRPRSSAAAGVVQPWSTISGWARQSLAVTAGTIIGPNAFAALTPIDYAGTFSQQIRGQSAFYQDIDDRLNRGTGFDRHTNTLTVPSTSLRDAATRLTAREQEQRQMVGTAYAWGLDIFDATIAQHAHKNQLWRAWMARASQGQTRAGGRVGRGFQDRVATTLARIIATAPGFSLLRQVDAEATALNIPISFIEETAGVAFNLSVGHVLNPTGDALLALVVTVPAGAQYSDAHSFKRANRSRGRRGYDVTRTGQELTAAPLDTDLFHEFVHAAHYLALERRRRGAGRAGRRQRNRAFIAEVGAYRAPVSGRNTVLAEQDSVAEAATIHRRGSLTDLRQVMRREGDTYVGGGTNPHYQGARNIDTISQIATGARIPAENTYRVAIGLAPRQDHRGLTLGNTGAYGYQSWIAPVNVV